VDVFVGTQCIDANTQSVCALKRGRHNLLYRPTNGTDDVVACFNDELVHCAGHYVVVMP